jgi:hypothetical protein
MDELFRHYFTHFFAHYLGSPPGARKTETTTGQRKTQTETNSDRHSQDNDLWNWIEERFRGHQAWMEECLDDYLQHYLEHYMPLPAGERETINRFKHQPSGNERTLKIKSKRTNNTLPEGSPTTDAAGKS